MDDADSKHEQPTDLAVRRLRAVTQLLGDRAELRGVHPFADLVEEAVRWTA